MLGFLLQPQVFNEEKFSNKIDRWFKTNWCENPCLIRGKVVIMPFELIEFPNNIRRRQLSRVLTLLYRKMWIVIMIIHRHNICCSFYNITICVHVLVDDFTFFSYTYSSHGATIQNRHNKCSMLGSDIKWGWRPFYVLWDSLTQKKNKNMEYISKQ